MQGTLGLLDVNASPQQQKGHKASDSLEAAVDEFADLLILERGGQINAEPEKAGENAAADKEGPPDSYLSDVIDAMQLWQDFDVLNEAGRARVACTLLLDLHSMLNQAGLLRYCKYAPGAAVPSRLYILSPSVKCQHFKSFLAQR